MQGKKGNEQGGGKGKVGKKEEESLNSNITGYTVWRNEKEKKERRKKSGLSYLLFFSFYLCKGVVVATL